MQEGLLHAFIWSSILAFLTKLPWTMIFYFSKYIRLYHITTNANYKCIQNNLKDRFCIQTDKGKGYGYALGFDYCLYLSDKDGWLICSENKYKQLIENHHDQITIIDDDNEGEHDTPKDNVNTIQILTRYGDYSDPWFRKRNITIAPITPRSHQKEIIDEIKMHYQKQNHTVCFISGPPNKGKTLIGLILATHFGSHYCNTLKPWQPGDLLADVYSEAEPTKEKPLWVVLDEIDIALLQIHVGIPQHKMIPINVSDKHGWNRFMDEIHWGMYPHLIMILITNKTFNFLNDLDSSYLREGRVDIKFDMSDK